MKEEINLNMKKEDANREATKVVYVYDICSTDPAEFNRVKRRFYYQLNKLKQNYPIAFISRSAIVISVSHESVFDSFFNPFCKDGSIVVFKIYTIEITTLNP